MIGAMTLHERRQAARDALRQEFREDGVEPTESDYLDEIIVLRTLLEKADAAITAAETFERSVFGELWLRHFAQQDLRDAMRAYYACKSAQRGETV